jgi:hypothetical protein
MTPPAVLTGVRARLQLLHGPIVRVAAWTGGSVAAATAVLFVVVFRQNGSTWASAIVNAVSDGFLLAVVGFGGFLISAPRCPRCRRWREVLTGAGGQDLCSTCWREITSD